MTKSRKLLVALFVTAGVAGAMTAPALADGWDHHRGARGHEWREHEWREHYRAFYPAPYAYAAPSYGYVAPSYGYAPAYGYAPPALSFNLNLPIR